MATRLRAIRERQNELVTEETTVVPVRHGRKTIGHLVGMAGSGTVCGLSAVSWGQFAPNSRLSPARVCPVCAGLSKQEYGLAEALDPAELAAKVNASIQRHITRKPQGA